MRSDDAVEQRQQGTSTSCVRAVRVRACVLYIVSCQRSGLSSRRSRRSHVPFRFESGRAAGAVCLCLRAARTAEPTPPAPRARRARRPRARRAAFSVNCISPGARITVGGRQQGGRGPLSTSELFLCDHPTSLHSHMSASSVSFSLLLVPLRLMEIGRAPLARRGGCGTLVVGWAVSSAAPAWSSAASSW